VKGLPESIYGLFQFALLQVYQPASGFQHDAVHQDMEIMSFIGTLPQQVAQLLFMGRNDVLQLLANVFQKSESPLKYRF